MEKFIKNLVRGAGAIAKKGYQTKMQINHKTGPWDLVTEFDLATEQYIIEKIRRTYPKHGILSEESGHLIKKKDFWIIDPIDGTTAFTRGLPQFAVCVAYVSNNTVKLGAVYNPVTEELFFAQKGKGAFLNGRRIHVSEAPELAHIWIAEHMARESYGTPLRKKVSDIIFKNRLTFMRVGSVQLSGVYTAMGGYDILISAGLNPWDYAACGLILAEAGARVTTIEGKPYRWNSTSIVAANPKLHKQMLKALK